VIGRSSSHVLIEGESGTGKNALARAIHAASPRAKKQLKYLLLRGMNERGLESCLFGHERNAFVGAFEFKEGVVQQCPGGTLILDQIDRLPPSIQERLAECLSTRSVRPVGATHSTEIDVRIVSLSNRPLGDLTAEGGFNSRLYKLLSGDEIVLPPLRDRGDDVGLIAREFLKKINGDDGSGAYLSDDALDLLCRFKWPRNIPQLQAVLLRAVAFSRSSGLTAEDFPDIRRLVSGREEIPQTCTHSSTGSGMPWVFREDGHVRPLEEVEAYVIKLAIVHYGGRISEVARRLQLGRSTLYRKLASLGIDGERPERSRHPRRVKNLNA
jgi:DNA-binding NtrC family response regulator